MPKIVDHEERRKDIARAVEMLVYEHGVDALTLRAVAKVLHCSPAIISHYFATKLEMLVFTHRRVRARAEMGLLAALEDGRDAVSCFEMLLPTDEMRQRDWHTWFAFWGMGPRATPAHEERHASIADSSNLFVRIIRIGQGRAEIPAGIDPATLAAETQMLLNGIASIATQVEAEWPAERQRTLFRRLFASLLALGGTPMEG